MKPTSALLLLIIAPMSLTGCVTENIRVVPKKVSVDAGVDFNPCGSEVEGYQFSPNGMITISCTNGTVYSVRNKAELDKLKENVIQCQSKGFNDYTECLTDKKNKDKSSENKT
ncbi:Csu type fimbrial protein [Photobacterium leiognathi]|uniref:hypothetical protein n=1 Tax=Photobacterium leiognathi TaxID=553611 RepID=UPI0029815555|nr:hypothetical protein [Photobacterium leiognathi]